MHTNMTTCVHIHTRSLNVHTVFINQHMIMPLTCVPCTEAFVYVSLSVHTYLYQVMRNCIRDFAHEFFALTIANALDLVLSRLCLMHVDTTLSWLLSSSLQEIASLTLNQKLDRIRQQHPRSCASSVPLSTLHQTKKRNVRGFGEDT